MRKQRNKTFDKLDRIQKEIYEDIDPDDTESLNKLQKKQDKLLVILDNNFKVMTKLIKDFNKKKDRFIPIRKEATRLRKEWFDLEVSKNLKPQLKGNDLAIIKTILDML